MSVSATTLTHYEAKTLERVSSSYDRELRLGTLTLGHSTAFLSLDKVAAIHAELGRLLDQMIDDKAIGFDTYQAALDEELTRLAVSVQPKRKPRKSNKPEHQILPPCTLTADERRAVVEQQKAEARALKAKGVRK